MIKKKGFKNKENYKLKKITMYMYQLEQIITDFIKRNVWCAITRIATLIFNLIPPKTKHKQIAMS